MRLLTIIPISKGIQADSLTYFTKENIESGSIVSVPLRKKNSYGLVVHSRPAEDLKSEIKNLPFAIRKVTKIKNVNFLSPFFVKSAEKIADYFVSSPGAVLSALIPTKILESSSELNRPNHKENTPEEGVKSAVGFHEISLLQSEDEDRYANYKSLIREEFARGRSVFFCMPTTEDLQMAKTLLEKGIEKFTYTMHAGMAEKEMVSDWKKILGEEHPVLIIGTGSFLCLPRKDLGTIILEKESSRGYKMQMRPYIDIRVAVEILAKTSGIRLVFGDRMLRIETLWKEKNGLYVGLSPLQFRSLSTAQMELLDMREPAHFAGQKNNGEKTEFTVLSDKLKEMLKKSHEGSERTFLFVGRKGLFPTTVCSDCGTVVTCKNCEAPVVLYGKKTGKQNLFVCHHCGERREADELCVHCRGWRLLPLGIGTDRVWEEIKEIYPERKVILLDKEHVSTHLRAVKARDDFYSSPGAVMIGTEMALTYLNQKIENTSVVSLDSFFSIPDFHIHEKIFQIILNMRSLASKEMLVQTRQEKKTLFDYALRGNLLDFYKDEIAERKEFGFPPFTTYLKVSIEGDKTAIKKQMSEIVEFLKPYQVSVVEGFNPAGGSGTAKPKSLVHGLISLESGKWVDPELLKKLRSLPPQCAVRIDPDTLL